MCLGCYGFGRVGFVWWNIVILEESSGFFSGEGKNKDKEVGIWVL